MVIPLIEKWEIEGDIIKETDKSYVVRKSDGSEVYVCKLCGKELDSVVQLAQHFASKHRNEVEEDLGTEDLDEENENLEEEQEEIETKNKSISSSPKLTKVHKILTPEEEMLEEMAKTLYEQMKVTPGIAGSNKIKWFVEHYFKRVRRLQEDEKSLFVALKRYFPKADDESIALIVDSIFEVRKQYESKLNYASLMGLGREREPTQPFLGFGSRGVTRQPTPPYNDPTSTIMVKMFDFFLKKLDEIDSHRSGGMSPEEVQKYIETEVQRRLLEEKLTTLEKQIEQQNKILQQVLEGRPKRTTEGGWTDDYARLMAELGQRVMDLTEQLIIENRKTRQLIIKHVIPKLIDRRVKPSGEVEEHEPTGSGETDQQIVSELEKEGLVEEE